MNTEFFTCSQCELSKPVYTDGGTGYAIDQKNNKICYSCCAVNDSNDLGALKPKEKICLYWDGVQVTNWPGSLKIKAYSVKKGNHNIAGSRVTVYFKHNGNKFTGINYGSSSQILHVRKTA